MNKDERIKELSEWLAAKNKQLESMTELVDELIPYSSGRCKFEYELAKLTILEIKPCKVDDCKHYAQNNSEYCSCQCMVLFHRD